MVDVKFKEERQIAKFDSGFDFGGKVNDSVVWKASTRPITTNLVRELSDKDLCLAMQRGGVAVALCHAMFKVRGDVHSFGFRSENEGVGFSLRVGEEVYKEFAESRVSGEWRQKVETELRRIPGRVGEEFQQYRYLYLESIDLMDLKNQPRKKKNFKKNKEIVIHDASKLFTSHDNSGLLDSGGFGVVRVCKNTILGTVAVKCIKLSGRELDVNEIKLRIEFEAKLHAYADHENIVKFHGITKWHNSFGLVMEFMDHGNLFHLIHNHENRPIKWNLRANIVRDIAAGLRYIHGLNMTHGDIKPQNILLGPHMTCKIGDFGAAVMATCSTSSTISRLKYQDQPVVKEKNPNKYRPQYTLYYLAPEYCANMFKKQRSPSQDIYSLGIMIYEVITRYQPFPPEVMLDKHEFKRDIKQGKRPDLEVLDEILSTDMTPVDRRLICDLSKVMKKCWEPKPEDRMSAAEVVDKCDDLVEGMFLDDDYLDAIGAKVKKSKKIVFDAKLSEFIFPFESAIKRRQNSPNQSRNISAEDSPKDHLNKPLPEKPQTSNESTVKHQSQETVFQKSDKTQKNSETPVSTPQYAKNSPKTSSNVSKETTNRPPQKTDINLSQEKTKQNLQEKQTPKDQQYNTSNNPQPSDSGIETGTNKESKFDFGIDDDIESVLKSLSIEEDAEGYWKNKEYKLALPALQQLVRQLTSPVEVAIVKLKLAHTLHQLGRRIDGDKYLTEGLEMIAGTVGSTKNNGVGLQLLEVGERFKDAGSGMRSSIIFRQAAEFFAKIPESTAAMSGVLKCLKHIRRGIKSSAGNTQSLTQVKKLVDEITKLIYRMDRTNADPFARLLYEAACFYHNVMEYNAAEKCNRDGLAAMRDLHGEGACRFSIYGICMHNLGGNLENQGKLKDAEHCFAEAIRCDVAATDWDSETERTESIEFSKRCLSRLRARLQLLNK